MPDSTNAALRNLGEADDLIAEQLQPGVPVEHQNVLREIAKALKSIRYGSIVLTVHEGQVVELTKTIRMRTRAAARG